MSTQTNIEQPAVTLSTILDEFPVDARKGIKTLEQLVNHLLQAAAVEMQTIPMYLYAMFSLSGRGNSRWDPGIGAQRLIRSIVVEEMLHLCMVRNILVALGQGGKAKFYNKQFIPDYPELMLHRHPDLVLHLGKCDTELVRTVFMEFERPKAKPGEGKPPKGQYATIGLFYKSIMKGLEYLDGKQNLWGNTQRELQYMGAYWNKDGGGEPFVVENLKTATQALKMIVDQGEGVDPKKPSVPIDPLNPKPGLDELPHYTKFQRIADGIEPIGPVWVVDTDPKSLQYLEDPAASSINDLFNAAYCYVLHMIDVIYSTSAEDIAPGARSRRYGLERSFMAAMQGVLSGIAEAMVARTLAPGGLDDPQIAPTFEYVDLPATGKKKHLIDLCNKAIPHFPQLGGDNSTLWLLNKMPDI
ncbi:ferritin-like domain-containing protein [Actinomadura oligospora]|uniref:ferritin-like domain-containing protein n=1 Tax=Actinomadura oligospora TaxID=111804 RepID=UPI00047CC6AC|nr:ferritin-like protein [Actinomadura oligospora]